MRDLLKAALLGAAASFGISVLLLPRPAQPAMPVPDEQDAAAETPKASELARMRREIAQLSNKVEDLSVDQEVLEDEVLAAMPEPPAEQPPMTDAQAEASLQRAMAFYDARFADEAVDRAWASQAEGAVEGHIQAWRSPGVSNLAVECRSSMCKVELSYDPAQVDPNVLAEDLGAAAPWPSNNFFHVELGGDHRARAWMSREGAVLPPPG